MLSLKDECTLRFKIFLIMGLWSSSADCSISKLIPVPLRAEIPAVLYWKNYETNHLCKPESTVCKFELLQMHFGHAFIFF